MLARTSTAVKVYSGIETDTENPEALVWEVMEFIFTSIFVVELLVWQ